MRAGKLNDVIEIRRPSYVDDGYGNQTETTTLVTTARAQIIEESTDEFMRKSGANTEVVRVFRVRHVTGLTVSDQVKHLGVTFNIRQIKAIGRMRSLEPRCVAHG